MSVQQDYKSGQWSADFITVVQVHKRSSCPTDYTFCFHRGSYIKLFEQTLMFNFELKYEQVLGNPFCNISSQIWSKGNWD